MRSFGFDEAKLIAKVHRGLTPSVLVHPSSPLEPPEYVSSHFGGYPRLPAELEWPRTSTGLPLHFMAQIACSELPGAAPLLPRKGYLFFFGRDTGDTDWHELAEPTDGCRVLYAPAVFPGTPLRPPPEDAPPIGHDHPDSLMYRHNWLLPDEQAPRVYPEWPCRLMEMDSWPDAVELLEDDPMGWFQKLAEFVTANPFRRRIMMDEDDRKQRIIAAAQAAVLGLREKACEASADIRLFETPKDHLEFERQHFGRQAIVQLLSGPQPVLLLQMLVRQALRYQRRSNKSLVPADILPKWWRRCSAVPANASVDAVEIRALLDDCHDALCFSSIRAAVINTMMLIGADLQSARLLPEQLYQVATDDVSLYRRLPRDHDGHRAPWDRGVRVHQMLGHVPTMEREARQNASDICLLRLETDPLRGFEFGDLGNATFWITRADLAKKRFDRVWGSIGQL